MAHDGRQMALLDVGIRAVPALYTIEEVPNVSAIEIRCRRFQGLNQRLICLLAKIVRHLRLYRESAAGQAESSFVPEDVERERVAFVDFARGPAHYNFGEFIEHFLNIGRLPAVGQSVTATCTRNRDGRIRANDPARYIEVMSAPVGHLAT